MFRIKETSKGYIVEVEKKKWYGKRYWQPFINWRGTNEPFHYGTFDDALDSLIKEVRWIAIDGSNCDNKVPFLDASEDGLSVWHHVQETFSKALTMNVDEMIMEAIDQQPIKIPPHLLWDEINDMKIKEEEG